MKKIFKVIKLLFLLYKRTTLITSETMVIRNGVVFHNKFTTTEDEIPHSTDEEKHWLIGYFLLQIQFAERNAYIFYTDKGLEFIY